FEDGDLLAALRIPDARGVVVRRRYHPLAVAAERCPRHWAGMSFQDRHLLAALRIPDAPGSPFRRAISLPLSASQMRVVLSSDTVATRLPSPMNAASDTE